MYNFVHAVRSFTDKILEMPQHQKEKVPRKLGVKPNTPTTTQKIFFFQD